jgi:hypothetical protein
LIGGTFAALELLRSDAGKIIKKHLLTITFREYPRRHLYFDI